jgi:hypothetical protein
MITIKQRNKVERERCKAEYDDKKERQNICSLFSNYKSRNINSANLYNFQNIILILIR